MYTFHKEKLIETALKISYCKSPLVSISGRNIWASMYTGADPLSRELSHVASGVVGDAVREALQECAVLEVDPT